MQIKEIDSYNCETLDNLTSQQISLLWENDIYANRELRRARNGELYPVVVFYDPREMDISLAERVKQILRVVK